MEWLGKQETLGNQPPPRKGHTMTRLLDSSLVLVFGGENAGGEQLNDMWSLHVERMEWRRITYRDGPVPPPRLLHSATAISSTAMVIMCGDAREHGSKSPPAPSRDVWVFDIRDCSWREIKGGGTVPPARSCHTAVFGNGLGQVPAIYVFGGFGNGEPGGSAMYRLRIGDWQWECLPVLVKDADGKDLVVEKPDSNATSRTERDESFPGERESHGALWLPGLNGMMIYGGDGGVAIMDDCWLFVPSSRRAGTWRWRRLTLRMARGIKENKLPACAGVSVVALPTEKTQVLLWGGILGANGEETLSPAISYLIDLDAMQTTRLVAKGTLPACGRLLHGFVRASNHVFAFGGCDSRGNVMEGLESARLLPDLKSIGLQATDFGPEAAGVAAGTKPDTQDRVPNEEEEEDFEEPDPNMPLMGPSSIPKGTPLSGRIIEVTDFGYFVSVIINGKLYKGVLVANPLKDGDATPEGATAEQLQVKEEGSVEKEPRSSTERKRPRLDPVAAQLPDSPQKRVVVNSDEVIALD